MKTNRLRLILTAALTVAVIAVSALAVMTLPGKAESAASPFAETYSLGETVIIPARSIDVDGKSVPATAVTLLPDGSAVRQDSVRLDAPGRYTVEYRALAGGITHKESYSFTVGYPMSTLSVRSDTAEYGTVPDTSVKGLIVKLSNGGTYTLNKTFDLSALTDGDMFINFFMVPDTVGSVDCREMYFRLEDAVDPDNFILIKIKQSQYGDGVVYISARAHNQPVFYGVEDGSPTGKPIDGMHGFAGKGSFYGTNFGMDGYMLSLGYDNATQTVYAGNNFYGKNKYVIDFNNSKCFDEGWSGFPSGKARLTIYGAAFDKASCSFVITYMAQTDLKEEILELTEPSEIIVDYGEYTADSYPSAVLGKPYKIFGAHSLEIYTPEKIETNVYTSYGSSVRTNVAVKDGYFTPISTDVHTIEYRCTDGFGNTRTFAVPIRVLADSTPITFEVNTSPVSVTVGGTLALPEVISITGGEGNVRIVIYLEDADGERTVVESDSLRMVRSGDFSLVYEATDYNGQTVAKRVAVSVAPTDRPSIYAEPQLPKVFLKKAKYKVPELKAEDYSSGTATQISTAVTVLSGTRVLPVEDGYFTVDAETEITLVYTAVNSAGKSTSRSFNVPVRDVGYGGSLDITRYFDTDGGTVTAMDRSMVLSANGSDTRFSFLRELMGDGFEIVFNIDGDKNGFSAVEIKLTDWEDESTYVTFLIGKRDEGSYLSVNGSSRFSEMSEQFGGASKDFTLTFNGCSLMIGNTSVYVSKDALGKDFGGFDDYVYCDITLKGVDGTAALSLKTLNRQPMTDFTYDVASPRVMFGGAYGGEREKDTVYNICEVYAVDVIDPYTEITISVQSPSKEYVKSVDGVLLKNAPADREYGILLTEYGRYSVSYTYADGSGNSESLSYVVRCLDKEPPVVTPEKTEISGEVGKEIRVPGYECSDNVSEGLTVTVQIVNPEGVISTVNDGVFVPEMSGRYIIRYLAIDSNFNITSADVVCNVK